MIRKRGDIAGFGLNWQHCGRQVFAGFTYSFEKIYQALRRSLRYGRVGPVQAHLIYAESEGSVRASLRHKQELYEAQLIALKGQYETERDAILRELDEETQRQKVMAEQRLEIARLRQADNREVEIQGNGARKTRRGASR